MKSPLIAASILAALTLVACDKAPPEPPAPPPRPVVSAAPEVPEPADLIKEDLSVGTGAEARDGDKVKVHSHAQPHRRRRRLARRAHRPADELR